MRGDQIGRKATERVGEGFKFIDLFAGMGGFHMALEGLGAECVFASEKDPYARATYEKTFSESDVVKNKDRCFNIDLTEVTRLDIREKGGHRQSTQLQKRLKKQIGSAIEPFHLLCAGFPCQPFSQAGKKKGFGDARGNLFFDIERILRVHEPDAIFLENVRNLLVHDNMNTITVIRRRLRKAGYGKVWTPVVWASEHGLPQHRPRVFIIGFRDREAHLYFEKNMPKPRELFNQRNPNHAPLKYDMSRIFGGEVTMGPSADVRKRRDIGFTLRVGGRMSPIEARQNWDCYMVNGKETRLQPVHGLMMQGFTDSCESGEDWFPEIVNDVQAMKLLGNSVAVPAIRDYARVIFDALRHARSARNLGA
jgi:DNA (cytosine-5)-methyltransferase 1